MTALLEVDDLHAYYGDSYILQGVSVEVAQGEVVAVLGRNGVGKTTLVRSIIGLTPPRRGRLLFDGTPISGWPSHSISRMGVGYVPQGRKIFPSLSVKEHLTVVAREKVASYWTLERVLSLFPNLRDRLNHPGNKLSGGEQQMLALGRALVGNPKLLLMDEPTEGLAPLIVRELGRVIMDLKSNGNSILLVEQHVAFAMRYADKIYIMSKGQIVHQCTPSELNTSTEIKNRYLGV